MGILGWIIVGFVAGALARAVTGGARDIGCLGTIVVGVVGGLIGGALFNAAGDEGLGEFGLRSMFVAFIGACVLLLLVGVATRGRYGGRRR
ncbi:MAG: GlsB/YeaQ/YmgE family stress response membrane protein [Actinomycetota bacterium]